MDFKKELQKYFRYWPWFLLSLILCLGAAFIYLKIVPSSYQTSAMLFIDKKQEDNSKIITISSDKKDNEENLEEEIRLVTSNEFLLSVVKKLKLNISYFEKVYSSQNNYVSEVPFLLEFSISDDLIPQKTFEIKVEKNGFLITDQESEKKYSIHGYKGDQLVGDLPFKVKLSPKAIKNPSSYFEREYKVTLCSTSDALKQLKSSLIVLADANSKGTMVLNYIGTNPDRSRKILNEIIVSLDKSIVINKQKTFTNTVTYLNKRIKSFTKEKDSIETVKEKYLQNNDILVMDRYILEKTSDRSQKNDSYMLNERQIEFTRLAIDDVKKTPLTQTLGTDYKLESQSINQLLINYNVRLMDSELILQRAQKNNPTYMAVATQLKVQKQEILNTLEGYLSFLIQTNRANKQEQSVAEAKAKSIPTKDKILGNINSSLTMKEEAYQALLQKREEAILNGAILDSNMKILNLPETNYSAIFPQPKSFMLGAFLLGLLVPFGIIYVRYWFDNKIHNGDDVLAIIPNIALLGHIPIIDSKQKLDNSATSRSLIAEATRSLVSNIAFLLPVKNDNKGKVILFTSSIQGEGKSFCAFHNAVTVSNLNKKVLLVGVDLRNPQLHDYFNIDRNEPGLTSYLSYRVEDWKGLLKKGIKFSKNLDVLLTGEIPLNPTQLITNDNFEKLIEEAKSIYDYIILDSAPVQMVSDTLNFSGLADATVYVVKYNFTEKNNLVFANNFIKKEQLKNVGILINGVNMKSAYGYGYGKNYSYHYQEAPVKRSWFKKKSLGLNEVQA